LPDSELVKKEIAMPVVESQYAMVVGHNDPSPFARVLVLGWYDGPEEGILQCADDGPVFRFSTLYSQFCKDDRDVRVYGLFPLPKGSLAKVIEVLSKDAPPKWPTFTPIWQFPSEDDLKVANREVDSVLAESGPLQWIVVGHLSDGPIDIWPIPHCGDSM
jgi:hypothetical protein